MRSLSDGEREIWNDSQRDGAPDWKTLSETRHTRRKGPVGCDGCHEVIEIGQRYKIVTALEDGRMGALTGWIWTPRQTSPVSRAHRSVIRHELGHDGTGWQCLQFTSGGRLRRGGIILHG